MYKHGSASEFLMMIIFSIGLAGIIIIALPFMLIDFVFYSCKKKLN
jgi:hypothetical protein